MLKALRQKISNFRHRRNFRQSLQEDYDWAAVYHATRFRQNFKQRAALEPQKYNLDALRPGSPNHLPQDVLNSLYQRELSALTTPSERRNEVLKEIDPQMYNLFLYIHQKGGENPYPKPVFRKRDQNSSDDTDDEMKRKMNVTDVEIFNPGLPIEHPEGFSLQIRKSVIDHPESGYGVHVSGVVLPGTVIALYPGVVYFRKNITPDVYTDNDYMISRYDDAIIDGRRWEKRAEKIVKNIAAIAYAGAAGATTPILQEQLKKFRNPFGIANYINHPPPGVQPNVICLAYDFPLDTPPEFIPYIPNEYSIPPPLLDRRFNCIMHSVACITLRPIVDEELFLNYRYNPDNPIPDWYWHPDLDAARRRWAPTSFFSN